MSTVISHQESCPVCHAAANRVLYAIAQGCLIRCQRCDLIFFTPRPSPMELLAYYDSQSYREGYRTGDMTGQVFAQNRYSQLYKVLKRYKPELLAQADKHLLDIGCGTGDFLTAATQHGWRIQGIEISATAAAYANQRLGNVVNTGDVTSIDLPHDKYDLVTSYHVIEHLLDPMNMLLTIRRLLRPGGVVFLETPNINSLGARIRGAKWSHITPPEHITYFNSASLCYALQQAGFQDIRTFTIRPQVIKSLSNLPSVLKISMSAVYSIAPLLSLGASLQAIATK